MHHRRRYTSGIYSATTANGNSVSSFGNNSYSSTSPKTPSTATASVISAATTSTTYDKVLDLRDTNGADPRTGSSKRLTNRCRAGNCVFDDDYA
jgi:hypothetical protein